MAPRRSLASTWGQTENRSFSFRFLVSIAVVVLIAGVAIGYLVRSANDKTPLGKLPKSAVAQSAVIDPSLVAMAAADNSQTGAVKAATSFITGYGDLALKSDNERNQTLDTLIDPAAPPTVKNSLQAALTLGQQQISSNGATTTAKIITTPVTYKVVPSGTQYTVSVWFMTTYLDSNGGKLVSGWSTDDLTMKFTDHWRLVNFVTNSGPTPPLYSINGQTSTYNDVANVLNGAFAYRSALSR